ncbi:MAG: 4Fe-4S dicluster domain-containing protein [Candidatus Eremiobacteraeota bacterium]|nr:4Fe-4S dicluster domain-containing protein [Candidatus Eremiobacteraeota bacterium]
MKRLVTPQATDRGFVAKIEKESGQALCSCNQCGKCSAGCPIAPFFDIMPHQVMRSLQWGLKDELLCSSFIWLCVNCMACQERCPRKLSVSEVADALRREAIAEKVKPAEPDVATFHKNFLNIIAMNGRLHEVMLTGLQNLLTLKPFKDAMLGMGLFSKGRLSHLPHRIKDGAFLKRIGGRLNQ